jgi:hypothetical protein
MAHDSVQTDAVQPLLTWCICIYCLLFRFWRLLFHTFSVLLFKKTNRQYGKTKGCSEKRKGARKNERVLGKTRGFWGKREGRSYNEASEAVASVKFQIYISFLFFSIFFLCQNVQNCHNFNEINMLQMPLKTLEIAFPRVWISKKFGGGMPNPPGCSRHRRSRASVTISVWLRPWREEQFGQFAAHNFPYGPKRFYVFTIVEKLPYNKHLINLVCSVRTVSYGSSFLPHFFMARALRAWQRLNKKYLCIPTLQRLNFEFYKPHRFS